jgi:Ran GTPase-activating protein (RanGAP) involved in mRNA processing and transport
MGALTSLHVGQNGIPQKDMREIIAIAMRMDSMTILCEVPFKDKTLTELDVSGKTLGMEGALVVAEYLDGNEALTKLDISSNNIGAKEERNLQRLCEASGIDLST